jgi:Ca2+-binding RTX toxin-like protein
MGYPGSGGGGSLSNYNRGKISGDSGVITGGAAATVINAGAIIGTTDITVTLNSITLTLGDGVLIGDGGVVVNHRGGNIAGANAGVYTGASGTTDVTNFHGALIQGTNFSLFAKGQVSLTNEGMMVGKIETLGQAVIDNDGVIKGAVELLTANDTFNGTGGTSGAIFAGGGNDRIIAGKGNVNIHVGGGSDTITGGPGADRFIFDSALTGQVEKITNFTIGVDKMVLSKADFAGIGPVGHPLAAADFHVGGHALKPSQHIVYNPSNGFLYYDTDGSGAMPQVHFATISAHLALTNADFLVQA